MNFEDLKAELRADELPDDRQYQREARTVLATLRYQAIAAIERLEAEVAQRDAELATSQEVLGEQLAIRQRLEAEVARLREANGILEDGLQEVGDDYPGSSCQEWCQHQIKQARAALEKPHD